LRGRHRSQRGALPQRSRAGEPRPHSRRGVRVVLFGRGGKVGSVMGPALEAARHELGELGGAEAMVDFTAPQAVEGNVRSALEQGIPAVVGTSGWEPEALGELARERGVALFYAPNFAIGAVLMMRLAEEAAKFLPKAEIIELHSEQKKDAPSGTAKATAERLRGAPIHFLRLPRLLAHPGGLFGRGGGARGVR